MSKNILKECSEMVAGMVKYYSKSTVSVEDIESVLRPLLGDLEKDNKGYIEYAQNYRAYVESEK